MEFDHVKYHDEDYGHKNRISIQISLSNVECLANQIIIPQSYIK